MRKIFTIFTLMIIVTTFLYAQPAHYQWHASFFTDWYGTGITTATENLGGLDYEYNTSQAISSKNAFVIEWDSGYNRWNNGTVPFNQIFTLYWHADANNNNPGDALLSTSTTTNNYYTLRIEGRDYSNRNAILMETSSSPVNITTVSDNNTGSGKDVTVTITTNSTPPTEQNIFVRYTKDSFSSWSIVQATGSGTSWTATIPASGNTGPTTSNLYYVYSSTLSLTAEQGLLGNDVYLSTISYNNNGGSNYPLGDSPTPVELSSFTSKVNSNNVELKWNTATEVNNFGFEVQRTSTSSTTVKWEKIGFVKGNGTTNSPKQYSFVDNSLSAGKYSYRLKQIDIDGSSKYSKVVEVNFGLPAKFSINQNYPNPFNPSTTISYALPEASNVKLIVYNSLGQKVADLVNATQDAGVHNINFNASNLTSGIYFYRIEAGNFTQVRKMILLK